MRPEDGRGGGSDRGIVAPLRVFSIPGANSTTQYVPLFCAGLQRAGAVVLAARSWRVWTLRFDIVAIHFAGNFIAERGVLYGVARGAATLFFLVAVKIVARGKVVYTVHDVVPMAIRNERLLWRYLGLLNRIIDGYMFLSDSSREEYYRLFPGERTKPFVRIDHSAFPVRGLDGDARAHYRASVADEDGADFLVGFLGSIKSYKGIGAMQALPARLRDGTLVRAVVAGRIEPAYREAAEQALAGLTGGAIRIDRGLSDEDLEHLIEAVDAVMLPYTGGWNSGMAMLALSLHARLLVSDRPIFVELERELGRPFVYVFANDPGRRKESLERCVNAMREDGVGEADHARLAGFLAERSFDRMGATLCGFYRRLLAGSY